MGRPKLSPELEKAKSFKTTVTRTFFQQWRAVAERQGISTHTLTRLALESYLHQAQLKDPQKAG